MRYKILIIGGTGVLSTDVVALSISRGHAVYILNRGHNIDSVPKNVILLRADIKNIAQVNDIVRNLYFDVVVDFLSYNITDIKNSLSLFKEKCHQFILISSACVYKREKADNPLTETSPLINPYWDYSKNKVECEKYLISKCTETGLIYTIVRPYITYGNTRIPYGIMPQYGWHWTLIARILNNKPIILWDNGEAVCTLTHTTDFAKGVVGLFCNKKAFNEEFHITSDERFTWKELVSIIGKLVDRKVITIEISSKYISSKIPTLSGILLGDRSLDAIFDNSKIKNAVSQFICTTSAEKGIEKTINYYRNNNFLKGIDYVWDAQIDRLIYEYLSSKNSCELKTVKINFVNYLSSSVQDKLTYYQYRYLPQYLIYLFEFIYRFINLFR